MPGLVVVSTWDEQVVGRRKIMDFSRCFESSHVLAVPLFGLRHSVFVKEIVQHLPDSTIRIFVQHLLYQHT